MSNSAEECATVCLDSSIIRSDSYMCLSFDYSSESKMCALYSSHLSDAGVRNETAPMCDHYSSMKLF